LVIIGVVIGRVTVLQAMGGKPVKTEEKTKNVEVAKTKSTNPSQKSIRYSKSAPKVHKTPLNIDNWKLYKSDIGSYEIKYPPNWKVEKEYPYPEEVIKAESPSTWIFYLPSSASLDTSSIDEALKSKKGFVVVDIKYSDHITMGYDHIEEILKTEKKKSKKKFLSIGILEVSKMVKDEQIFFTSCLKTNKGYYLIEARIYDPFNKGYENLVKQILSTFKN